MTDTKSYHMSSEDFRKHGKMLIDWIADYYESIESHPVLSQVKPGDIRSRLPVAPPIKGESFTEIMDDIESIILPGITHWQSPNFFAYFPTNNSGPSLLGDLLSSGLGVQGMIWATSPACTELETHVLDWLVDMLALPAVFKSDANGGGVIQDTASSAALTALLTAREYATKFTTNEHGVSNHHLTVYASSQAHSSIEKAVKIAGIGRNNLRIIETDDQFAMRADALEKQITMDKHAGLLPCFVAATVGTTSSNAIDPLDKIGPICKRESLWLHVDAAMSGTSALCPEFRHIHKGLEYANSYAFNPHKWMFTNFDCNCFFVADKAALIKTLSILPEYLRNQATESGAVIDYRDWQIPLGRRFRSLKLWFVIRHYGIEGLQYHIRHHVAMAREFADWVKQDDDFELVVSPPLNLVCFRHKGGNDINQRILEHLNQSGKLYLTHTKLDDKYTLRLCIAQTRTEPRHVKNAWEMIKTIASSFSDSTSS